jgi:hypothetical protein
MKPTPPERRKAVLVAAGQLFLGAGAARSPRTFHETFLRLSARSRSGSLNRGAWRWANQWLLGSRVA